jgi:hypothetical protein
MSFVSSKKGLVPGGRHVGAAYCLEDWRGKQRISPPGDKINPWETTSPLGSKFAPRGEVKNGPQCVW